MRRRPRQLRPLLALLLAASLASAGVQLAHGADAPPPDPHVTLVRPDGSTAATISLADLLGSEDVHDATYTVRAADGTTRTVDVTSGLSLGALLDAAGVDPTGVTYVEIPRGDGTNVLVLHDQLAGSGTEGPPVLWLDADGVHVLRPSAGERDANAGDVLTLPGPVTVQLRSGEPLVPRIAASTVRARPNTRIVFHASLAAGTLADGMTYQWYFDDGAPATGARATHRFRRPGRYLVLLNVVRGDGSVSDPAVAEVRIVRPRAQRHGDGTGKTGEGTGGTTGTGTGTGTGTATGGTTGTTGTAGGTTTYGSGTPQTTRPPVQRHPRAHRPPRRPPTPHVTWQREPQGDLVSGTLLASVSTAPLAGAAPGGAARAGAGGAAPADAPLHVPAGAWVAVGLAALIALGWALEARHTPPYWQP